MPEPLDHHQYWRTNKKIIASLLVVWFVVSFGLGILFVEPLNKVMLGGFPLGFWISQQGSIVVFVLLILVYCLWMDAEDRKYHVEESEESEESEEGESGRGAIE